MNDVLRYHCPYCGTRLALWRTPPCWMCEGNAARAERLKIELGVRIRYLRVEWRVSDPGPGTEFIIELYRRLDCYGRKLPPALREWVTHIEHGYCIDAPNIMPSGSVVCEDLSDLLGINAVDSLFPALAVCYRENNEGA